MENLLWRNSKWASKLVAMTIACLAVVWVAVPFLWAIGNSLKTHADIFKPGAIIPFLQFTPTLDAWKFVIDRQVINCFFSSSLVGVGTSVLVLVIGTPSAYSLARFEFKRMKSKDITLWFLSQRVLPPVVVLTPFYIMLAQFGLIDTWFGLILLYSTFNLPFCVVIMRDIFPTVTREAKKPPRLKGPPLCQLFCLYPQPLPPIDLS